MNALKTDYRLLPGKAICSCLALICTCVLGADWRTVAVRPDMGATVDVDRSSIVKKGEQVELLLRTTLKDNAQIEYTIMTMAYRCGTREEKLLKTYAKKRDGSAVEQNMEGVQRWHGISLNSITGDGFKAACM